MGGMKEYQQELIKMYQTRVGGIDSQRSEVLVEPHFSKGDSHYDT